MTRRILAVFLTVIMIFTFVPVSVFAVTGDQTAADGIYSSMLTGYKKGEAKYTATLGVEVENGKITSLWLSNVSKDKMFKAFNSVNWQEFVGIPATYNAVSAVEDSTTSSGVDTVSSATTNASGSSSSKYSVNLKETILKALSSAPQSASSVSSASDSDTVYTGSSTVDAYSLTLNVAVDSDGKITDIAVADGSTGNWDSVLAAAKNSYVGQSTGNAKSSVDAVSGATKYSAAFNTALSSALSTTAGTESGSADSGQSITTYTGNGGVQNITIQVGETIKLVSSYSTSSSRQWTTSEWDGDTQLYTDDSDENGNTITVIGTANSGDAVQTYKYYGKWLSTNSEEFRIKVEGTAAEEPQAETVEAPAHVKSITPDGAADNYTIKLNVTGKDITSSSTTTTPGETVDKGTNLVMVIDISASIIGKESALNSAIKSLVSGLPDNSQVGIVTFNESASMSKVYSKNNISGLSFSGVENAGTKMATGISAATSLLNGSGWSNANNNKAMVIISDFDADDYADSINNAKTAKNGGIKIYSVKVDASAVGAASTTELTTDNRDASVQAFTRYVSSQYSTASAVNNSMFGMFNQATVTAGTADNSAAYVYGAGGGNWDTIFAEIKETQQITETTEITLHTKGVVIQDVLSDYVEFSGSAPGYGITVDGLKSSQYTVSVDEKTAKVTFSSDFELTDGTIYTVNIPVKPTAKAQTEANAASASQTTFPSNMGATLIYQYGDNTADTVAYAESPVITVLKENTFTLNYDANGGTGAPDSQTQTAKSSSYDFTISSTEPTREGYTFGGWQEEDDDKETVYQAGSTVTVYDATTLKAIWTGNTYTVTWLDDNGTELEKDENVSYWAAPSYDGEPPVKSADAQYTYTFSGWNKELVSVTEDVTYTAVYESTLRSYTVTWLDEDGTTVLKEDTVTYGETPSYTGETPTKQGDAQHSYVFAGWTPEITVVTGNVTYTAQYTESNNSYTVRFLNWNDEVLSSQAYPYGAAPDKPENPTRAESIDETTGVKTVYTFTGWDKEISAVTGDTDYKALYSEIKMYRIFIADYAKTAVVNGVVSEGYYIGEVKFTVSAEQAVAFGIDNKDDTYTRLYCTANEDNTYTFTITVEDADVYLVEGYKGDVNLDGKVTLKDSTIVKQVVADIYETENLNKFIGNTDKNESLNLKDSTIIKQSVADIYTIEWDADSAA